MARRLEGKRIALTGPRRAEELGKLVENLGEFRCTGRPKERFCWTTRICGAV